MLDATPDLSADPAVLGTLSVLEGARSFAKGLVIKTAERYQEAANLLKAIKGSLATIEDARTRITRPLNETLREVNAQAKAAAEPFVRGEQSIKSAMVMYSQEQSRLRMEEQRKQNEAAEQERRRLQEIAARAAAKGDENKAATFLERAATVVAPIVQREVPKVTGVTVREVWLFQVTDASKVNPAFLMPDEQKIRKVVQSMKADAAELVGTGVRIWADKQIASAAE